MARFQATAAPSRESSGTAAISASLDSSIRTLGEDPATNKYVRLLSRAASQPKAVVVSAKTIPSAKEPNSHTADAYFLFIAQSLFTILHSQIEPLLVESGSDNSRSTDIPPPISSMDSFFLRHFSSNPEFFKQAFVFSVCFLGLQVSYLCWGYLQEKIMTTEFTPTERVPNGKFPSAAFCVFSNRFLAVIVALICVRVRHGAFFSNNKAPLWSFTPCALSNTLSSWSQYASLKYVSFPVQTVFKSSKIIPVMVMGKCLKGTKYPYSMYAEAALITLGVAVFSFLSKSSKADTQTEMSGLVYLLMYVSFDSFTSQWQDKVYTQYGRANVDPYQMMLGVNISAICITTAGLILSGDLPVVIEFLQVNPVAFHYNIWTAVTSASGQLFIFFTIKEFGPIVFTIIMTTRQMFSICLSAIMFGHYISPLSASGALLVFGVLFFQIERKYHKRMNKFQSTG